MMFYDKLIYHINILTINKQTLKQIQKMIYYDKLIYNINVQTQGRRREKMK